MPDDAPPRVDVLPPDISNYYGNTDNIPYVTTLDSGRPGPDAMVNAVTHGNEICGAIALDFLLSSGYVPTKGKLTCAFVNHVAYTNWNNPERPSSTRFVDEDMNRIWTPEHLDDRADETVELARARELRPFFDRVDHLLDIHSMGNNYTTQRKPIALCRGDLKQRQFCAKVGVPQHVGCGEPDVVGQIIDYTPFREDPAKVAYLVECGSHYLADTAAVAKESLLHYLRALDMIDPAFYHVHAQTTTPPEQVFLEITDGPTVQTDHFAMHTSFEPLSRIRGRWAR
jgi:predicted deacylase